MKRAKLPNLLRSFACVLVKQGDYLGTAVRVTLRLSPRNSTFPVR